MRLSGIKYLLIPLPVLLWALWSLSKNENFEVSIPNIPIPAIPAVQLPGLPFRKAQDVGLDLDSLVNVPVELVSVINPPTQMKLHLFCTQSSILTGFLRTSGSFAPVETYIFHTLLFGQPRKTVVDVGVNIGYFSHLARQVYKANLIGFDANPEMIAIATLSYKLWKDNDPGVFALHSAALSKEEGRVKLSFKEAGGDNAFARIDDQGDDLEAVDIPAVRLDKFLQETYGSYLPIHLLKIDTEGHEDKVLSGATAILEGGLVDNIVMELKLHVGDALAKLCWLHKVVEAGNQVFMYEELYSEGYASVNFKKALKRWDSGIMIPDGTEDFWIVRKSASLPAFKEDTEGCPVFPNVEALKAQRATEALEAADVTAASAREQQSENHSEDSKEEEKREE